jgi:hypothetical protein
MNRIVRAALVGWVTLYCGIAAGAEYARVFSGPGTEGASGALGMDGREMILAGATSRATGGDSDALLVKLDENGDPVWEIAWGGAGDEVASVVRLGTDGNCWIAGVTESAGAGGYDIFVRRARPDGSVLWQKSYGSNADDSALDLQPTTDGGAIVVGSTKSIVAEIPYVLAIRIDSAGAVQWKKAFGPTGAAAAVIEAADGGFVLGGYLYTAAADQIDHLVLKLDTDGTLLWDWIFRGSGIDYVQSVVSAGGGSILVAGATESFGAGGADWHLLKLDSSGALIWNKVYGGSRDEGFPVARTAGDGGFVVAGPSTSGSPNGDQPGLLLLRLDSAGSISWQQRFQHPTLGATGGVVVRGDELAVYGMLAQSFEDEGGDLLALGLDVQGNLAECAEVSAAAVSTGSTSVTRLAAHVTEAAPSIAVRNLSLTERQCSFFVDSPCPTRAYTATPTPHGTTSPTPTPTAACSETGVTLTLPRSFYQAGQTFSLDATVCNAGATALVDYPLFVILDVYGQYWFAPTWTKEFSYYDQVFPPGIAVLHVIPAFAWPAGAGQANGIVFWGAFTDPGFTAVFGTVSRVEFGFSS